MTSSIDGNKGNDIFKNSHGIGTDVTGNNLVCADFLKKTSKPDLFGSNGINSMIGDWLKFQRINQNIKIEDLSLLDLDSKYIQELESGDRSLPALYFFKIVQKYAIDTDDIINFLDQMSLKVCRLGKLRDKSQR